MLYNIGCSYIYSLRSPITAEVNKEVEVSLTSLRSLMEKSHGEGQPINFHENSNARLFCAVFGSPEHNSDMPFEDIYGLLSTPGVPWLTAIARLLDNADCRLHGELAALLGVGLFLHSRNLLNIK